MSPHARHGRMPLPTPRGALSALGAAVRTGIAAAMLACAMTPAAAQNAWPNKPVRVIVPSSPGGGTDIYARLVTQALSEQLRQNFIVENRPGASGTIGADAAARAEPDGYTFLIASNSSITISPGLYPSLPFDASRDFTPVTRGVMAPMVIVVHPDSGIESLEQLVERGKSQPGSVFYGSPGVASGPYLGVRMLEEITGAEFSHVPYKGVAPAMQDLLSGRLQFMFPDLAAVKPHVESGRLKPIAVNDATHLLPGVPALDDAGVKGLDAHVSFSVLGPAGIPPDIARRMNEEVARAMHSPAVAQRLDELALVPVFDTPEEFARSLEQERQHWAAFIKRNGITPDQ